MAKKRYIIQFKSGNYLENEWPVSSTYLIGEAKIFTKKKEVTKALVENLQAWYHPGAQILEWKPPKPGRWKPLKQKTKLQPVTHWHRPPTEASNEAKPATDSEARGLDSSEVTRWHFARGLELLGDNHDCYNRKAGETIVDCKMTEGNFNKINPSMLSHGFNFKLIDTGGECQWSFDWSQWEAEAKETEAEADSMLGVCDSCRALGHSEANCPQKVS